MSLGNSFAGIDFTKTSTTREFKLGEKVKGFNGSAGTEYVYIEAGANLTAGKAYVLEADGKVTTGVSSSYVGYNVCIPQVDIASGSFGLALVDGPADYLYCLSGCSAAQALYTSATAGAFDDVSGGQKRAEGLVVLDSQATANGTFAGYVVGPLRIGA